MIGDPFKCLRERIIATAAAATFAITLSVPRSDRPDLGGTRGVESVESAAPVAFDPLAQTLYTRACSCLERTGDRFCDRGLSALEPLRCSRYIRQFRFGIRHGFRRAVEKHLFRLAEGFIYAIRGSHQVKMTLVCCNRGIRLLRRSQFLRGRRFKCATLFPIRFRGKQLYCQRVLSVVLPLGIERKHKSDSKTEVEGPRKK